MPVASDPIQKFNRWLSEARRAGIELAESMALATSDSAGRPSVRFVLLKEADESGFSFYTNSLSRKGGEIEENPRASVAFYWHQTQKQVRAEGHLVPISKREADAYWKERPRESQIAALASIQSAPLERRKVLLDRYQELTRQYEGREIPRPPHWAGYRLVADRIEFWTREEPRLHHRELYIRKGDGWSVQMLQP
jgi:pyridoxamine 5'-phosphate oxidase